MEIIITAIIIIGFIGLILKNFTNATEWGLNKALENIEKKTETKSIESAENALEASPESKKIEFGNWDSKIHCTLEQRNRIIRAKSSHMTPGIINHTTNSAEFYGSLGTYHTTLNSCTCPDFQTRKLPCKHIYKLAMELGEMDFNVNYDETHTININIDVDDIIDRINNLTPEEKRINSLIFDFEDENEKELMRWEQKLDKVRNYENPNRKLKAYEKRVELAKDFKFFCELNGEGGELWYQKYYSNDIRDAELELLDYEENDYENELLAYKEAQQKKKLNAKIRSTILTLAAQENGILQKELYSMFKPEDKNTVKRIVEKLIADNLIVKEKQGKFNLLKISKQ